MVKVASHEVSVARVGSRSKTRGHENSPTRGAQTPILHRFPRVCDAGVSSARGAGGIPPTACGVAGGTSPTPLDSRANFKTSGEIMARTKFTNSVSVQTATGQVALSPNQVANLRGQIAKNMSNHIVMADEVLKGHREWSPTQARVFSNLLNKVIPDLSASYHQHEHSHKS